MREVVIRNILRFIALLCIQILVLDNIYLGGYINPLIYVLFVLMLPNKLNKKYILLLSFLAGLCMDVYANMLGFHSLATTVMAFCRIMFADKIITRGEDVRIDIPSIYSVAPQFFMYYSALLIFIYNLVYYSIEMFSLANLPRILLSSVLTTVASLILIVVWQLIFLHKKKQ